MTSSPPVEIDVELDGPPVLAVSLPTGESGVVLGNALILYGWSVRETSGSAAAQIDLYDGADATGQLVATVTVPSGGSVALSLGNAGVECRRGLWADAVAGSVAGAVWASRV